MFENDQELDKYTFKELEKQGLMARESKYNSWVSRDYKEVACKAIGCKYNIDESCAVPSRANFDKEAKCSGFEMKEFKKEIEGD